MKLTTLILFAAFIAGGFTLTASGEAATDGGHAHRHHVGGLFGGSVKSDGKVAGTYGLEYVYSLHPRFGLGVFYEWSSGDYDAEGGGLQTSIALPHDFKLLLALGVERELFEDNELLLRIGANYNLHAGRFTIAPITFVDFVHGKQILFVGLTAGIGF